MRAPAPAPPPLPNHSHRHTANHHTYPSFLATELSTSNSNNITTKKRYARGRFIRSYLTCAVAGGRCRKRERKMECPHRAQGKLGSTSNGTAGTGGKKSSMITILMEWYTAKGLSDSGAAPREAVKLNGSARKCFTYS